MMLETITHTLFIPLCFSFLSSVLIPNVNRSQEVVFAPEIIRQQDISKDRIGIKEKETDFCKTKTLWTRCQK